MRKKKKHGMGDGEEKQWNERRTTTSLPPLSFAAPFAANFFASELKT